jgi:ribosome maturation factor RimP
MALQMDAIRGAADRVAGSLHLEVVETEFTGGAKFRTLRIFVEKDATERAKLAAAVTKAGAAAKEADAAETETEGEQEGMPGKIPDVPVEQLSGVTHEDCEAFARDFGMLLDVEDLIPGAEYTLEVSSPGLDRKLRTAADFERFAGNKVKLQTFTAVNGNRHWTGHLAGVSGGKLSLDLAETKVKGKAAKAAIKAAAASKAAGATRVELELANIEKANLVPEI